LKSKASRSSGNSPQASSLRVRPAFYPRDRCRARLSCPGGTWSLFIAVRRRAGRIPTEYRKNISFVLTARVG